MDPWKVAQTFHGHPRARHKDLSYSKPNQEAMPRGARGGHRTALTSPTPGSEGRNSGYQALLRIIFGAILPALTSLFIGFDIESSL